MIAEGDEMEAGGKNEGEMRDVKGDSKEKIVLMWGYLPGVSPQRLPMLSPAAVPMPESAAGDSWRDVCGGGCGFAMAISERMDISGTAKPGVGQTASAGRGKGGKKAFQAFLREQQKSAAVILSQLARTGGTSGAKCPAPETAKPKKAKTSAVDLLALDENAEVRTSPVQTGDRESGGARAPVVEAEPIIVSDGGSNDVDRRQSQAKNKQPETSSHVLARRDARRDQVKSYFEGRQWTEAEIADLELIMHKRLPVVEYDSLVEKAYVPPYVLDAEDSALLDPTVAARVAHNAYLPADRKGIQPYDTDVMGSNMVSTMVKALNMATEFNIRVAEISRKETGLEGFKTRAEEAEARALEAEKERNNFKGALEAEKKISASSCAQVVNLEVELSLLKKESDASNQKLVEAKAEVEKKVAAAEQRAAKAKDALKAAVAARKAALQEKASLEKQKAELEKMCGEGFAAGFWECRGQIIRKFPNHGLDLDLQQLDLLEEDPNDEEEGEADKDAA